MQPEPQDIQAAADELRRGGVVAFPTETVYGLGAVAWDARAVAKVFALKGRPAMNPLIVHVADEAMIRRAAKAWPERAAALARAFWPGPLSIVVERAAVIPDIVTAGGTTVCVRMPDHPVVLALIEAVGEPLVGPSANRSGGVSPTAAEHVRRAFPELTVVEGGPCRVGIESTVVRLDEGGIEILRPGVIGVEELSAATGERVRLRGGGDDREAPLQSPGLLSRHYAPRTPVRVVELSQLSDFSRAAVLVQPSGASIFGGESRSAAAAVIQMPSEARAYAAALYDALRRADALNLDEIVIVRPSGPGPAVVWVAIADRIARMCAAAGDGS